MYTQGASIGLNPHAMYTIHTHTNNTVFSNMQETKNIKKKWSEAEQNSHPHREKEKESDEIDYTQCRYRTAKFIPNEFGQQRRRQRSKKRRKRRPCLCAYDENDEENKPILSAATATAVVTVARSHIMIVLGRGKELAEYLLGELLFSSDARAHLQHDIFVL